LRGAGAAFERACGDEAIDRIERVALGAKQAVLATERIARMRSTAPRMH
jgi:hypothetical protein